jgi:hypothetical protein
MALCNPFTPRVTADASVRKPHVTWKAIPFGAKRRHETAAYSKPHC